KLEDHVKTLVLFSTRDGQGTDSASYLDSEHKDRVIWTALVNRHRAEERDWGSYDPVVIGASILYGHYHSAFQ
uniref:flavodoxin domain-containing protein n=1 Tax=Salmonella enterica TaxID=28901 RepID=UPI00398C4E36